MSDPNPWIAMGDQARRERAHREWLEAKEAAEPKRSLEATINLGKLLDAIASGAPRIVREEAA